MFNDFVGLLRLTANVALYCLMFGAGYWVARMQFGCGL